jgi:hypothetical protein
LVQASTTALLSLKSKQHSAAQIVYKRMQTDTLNSIKKLKDKNSDEIQQERISTTEH